MNFFKKKVQFSLNIPTKFGIITIAIEMADDGGQVARALVSADTSHKPLFDKQGKVMNISICNMWSINNASRPCLNRLYTKYYRLTTNRPSTIVEIALQNHLFMQNKANFRKSQMNISCYITMDYDKMDTWSSGKNEPKTNPKRTQSDPIKPNLSRRSLWRSRKKPNFTTIGLQQRPKNYLLKISCLMALSFLCWDYGF